SLLALLFSVLMTPRAPRSTLFPYTTLFRSAGRSRSASWHVAAIGQAQQVAAVAILGQWRGQRLQLHLVDPAVVPGDLFRTAHARSEEHTSELQSRENLVCRLLLEKKNDNYP